MLNREHYKTQLVEALRHNPIVALIGARQIGKTTLARELLSEHAATYFDLEDPTVAALMENPMSALGSLKGLVVIDEAQRAPEIFPTLRVLADRSGARHALPHPRQCLSVAHTPSLRVLGRTRRHHRDAWPVNQGDQH